MNLKAQEMPHPPHHCKGYVNALPNLVTILLVVAPSESGPNEIEINKIILADELSELPSSYIV